MSAEVWLKFSLITCKSICPVLENAWRVRELYEDKWDVTQGVEMLRIEMVPQWRKEQWVGVCWLHCIGWGLSSQDSWGDIFLLILHVFSISAPFIRPITPKQCHSNSWRTVDWFSPSEIQCNISAAATIHYSNINSIFKLIST